MADPLVRTIRIPNRSREMIIGRSQNFFRTFRKPQRSFMKSIVSVLREREN